MIKGALFDMDGTLSSTIQYWKEIIPNYIKKYGFEVDESIVGSQIHAMSMQDSAAFVRDYYNLKESADDILNSWRASADHIYTDVAVLKEGAYQFVHRLHDMGIPMVIVTNNDQKLADALLRRTGIRDCFSELFCGCNLGLGKTEPTLIEMARKAVGTDAKDTWMFEDSLGPIVTAKGIGIHTVAMIDDNHEPEEIASIREEAENVFDTYEKADHWLTELLAK